MRYVLAAAVLPPEATPPPGVDREAYHRALLTDAFESLDDLEGVTAYVAATNDATAELRALHGTGATIGAVVAGDAPDLPGLLVGKLFGACEDTLVGVLPAAGGGLVGLAARLPVPGWLDGVTLDTEIADLHERAPLKAVQVGPGWHRLRKPTDIARLDPRLEGWAATRALLSGYSSSG